MAQPKPKNISWACHWVGNRTAGKGHGARKTRVPTRVGQGPPGRPEKRGGSRRARGGRKFHYQCRGAVAGERPIGGMAVGGQDTGVPRPGLVGAFSSRSGCGGHAFGRGSSGLPPRLRRCLVFARGACGSLRPVACVRGRCGWRRRPTGFSG